MQDKKLSAIDYQIFLYKTLIWLGIAWGGFALALVGFFYTPIIIAMVIASIAGMTFFIFKNHIPVRISSELWIVTIALLLVVILFSVFSTPTVFSGRDQGSLSEAAVRLVQNHAFEFSTPASAEFFKIYGPGRALNFPGFYYTSQGQLITQFPLIYIVWLAIFYALFGLTGFAIANGLLLFIFLLSFYLIARLFLNPLSALPTIIFAVTSFLFMWFSKFTLSENMALALLWLTILSLMCFLKNPRKMFYAVFLASAGLLFFTRIEGVAFLVMAILIILLSKKARLYIKEAPLLRFFLPAGIFVVAFILNAYHDINFYREIAKALLPEVALPQAQYLSPLKESSLPSFYIEKVFALYGMLGFFIAGIVAVITFLWKWKKEKFKLVPLLVVAPTFIYFLHSFISSDAPWMLRRFVFSLLPVAILYSGLLIGQGLERSKNMANKLIYCFVAFILIAANIPAFSNYLTFSENKNLLPQVETLSQQFGTNDLVLIDQQATGDGWTMISGPLGFLYGKNAAYFFNTQDLAKLDLQKFDNVYLIAPDKQISYYLNSTIGNRLSPKSDFNFTFPKLATQQRFPLGKVSFPDKTIINATGKIFKIAK